MTLVRRGPEARIAFYAINQNQFNVQGANKVVQRFEEVMLPAGNNWLFQENASTTPFGAIKFEAEIRKYGHGVRSILESYADDTQKGPLTLSQAQSVERRIRSLGLKRSLERGLIPLGEVRHIYYGVCLDDLKRKKPFELKLEEQEEVVRKEEQKLVTQSRGFLNKSDQALGNLDIDGALNLEEKAKSVGYQLGVIRHPGIISTTKQIVSKVVERGKGGTIYMPFGFHHEYVIDEMRDDPVLSSMATFIISVSHGASWDRIFNEAGRQGKAPPFSEELLIKALSKRVLREWRGFALSS